MAANAMDLGVGHMTIERFVDPAESPIPNTGLVLQRTETGEHLTVLADPELYAAWKAQDDAEQAGAPRREQRRLLRRANKLIQRRSKREGGLRARRGWPDEWEEAGS